MGNYNFGEKRAEYSPKQQKDIPVWQSPKYSESKAKAVELLDDGRYGLKESDFWILMNETKSGKMGYTGLIISHNGCLKINDTLPAELRFKPECVTEDKDGWGGALILRYVCPEQGLYSYGEVSPKNCRNDYPYAMAEKRLFDRVVLKNSKIAYAGIYSEAEADDFRDPIRETEAQKAESKPTETAKGEPNVGFWCETCGAEIKGYRNGSGEIVEPMQYAIKSRQCYGKVLCPDCIKQIITAKKQ